MKVAIPVTRDIRISAHFGRSPAFLVLDVDQGEILHRELRPNDQAGTGSTPHAHHDHAEGHSHGHDHGRFVQLLGDCRAVVGLGMGAGARFSLESAGILVRILEAPCAPEEAAIQFEAGRLEGRPGPTCQG